MLKSFAKVIFAERIRHFWFWALQQIFRPNTWQSSLQIKGRIETEKFGYKLFKFSAALQLEYQLIFIELLFINQHTNRCLLYYNRFLLDHVDHNFLRSTFDLTLLVPHWGDVHEVAGDERGGRGLGWGQGAVVLCPRQYWRGWGSLSGGFWGGSRIQRSTSDGVLWVGGSMGSNFTTRQIRGRHRDLKGGTSSPTTVSTKNF